VEAFVALLFAATGLGSLLWSSWNVVQALACRRWPVADGVIVVSDLQRSRGSDGAFMYRPEVTYRYEVQGRQLVSSRTQFGDRLELSWSRPAVQIVQKYPVGTRVSVRYAPDDPEEAVLETGVRGILLAGIACGVIFLALGILAWSHYS
jgi:hypothetical protein